MTRAAAGALSIVFCATALCAEPARIPEWVYPFNPPSAGEAQPLDGTKRLHVPGSRITFTEAELGNLFSAPGWFPKTHSEMPEIVAKGRPPDVYACGYCHTPGGQGRPENAPLAGLPADYIIQQVADFKSGARRGAWHSSYLPADLMTQVAAHASAAEVASAARYFSRQRLGPRVRILERDRVPRSRIIGWVYAAIPGGGDEPLGERLLEFAPDPGRHERRDDRLEYVAYAPRGSVKRGRSIALDSVARPTVACASCHGVGLRGAGPIPPLAGRSPTYLMRQLFAFQTGARAGANAPQMLPAAALPLNEMIDVVAYAASLSP